MRGGTAIEALGLHLLPLPSYALAIAIVLVAAMVQSNTGMGFGLVAAPLLAVIDVELVPVPVLLLGFVTATMAAVRERPAIHWDEVGIGLFGRVSGAFLAALVLYLLPDRHGFSLAFGLSILVAVILSVAGVVLPLNRISLVTMGTVSGLTGTITSVGAPPMAIVYQNAAPGHARPTLSAFFSFGAMASFLVLAATGRVDLQDFVGVVLLAPAMYAGVRLAPYCRDWIDRRFRWIALALATAAAIRLIVVGIVG
ncbi:MAG: hypothetical protein C0606_04440 [Hyphomicrobiales bacterium]|nr:MAG: hypothetical protein C0606_04440 [Hyphomicrobiales bacterium]